MKRRILEILLLILFMTTMVFGAFKLCQNAHRGCLKKTTTYSDYRFCMGI